MSGAPLDDAGCGDGISEQETPWPRKRQKAWPKNRYLRFVKLARLNYRVGGGLGPSVRVAWKDTKRG